LLRQRKVPKRKATPLFATRSKTASNLRWVGFAGESLELAALRQLRLLIPQNPPIAGAYRRGWGANIQHQKPRAAAQHIVLARGTWVPSFLVRQANLLRLPELAFVLKPVFLIHGGITPGCGRRAPCISVEKCRAILQAPQVSCNHVKRAAGVI